MKDFISKILDEPLTSQPVFKFVPQIKISPKSTLHLQIQPNDPHTASNIVINAFVSKTNRSIVPVKIEWSRYKLKSDQQYTIQRINGVLGNTYMCEPSDLGSIIQAKVRCIDPMISGEAEATIGPIRIDPMLKRLIDGALYSESLLSQVIVIEGEEKLNINLRMYKNIMQFTETNSQQKLTMPYTFSQPKLQLSPKDPCKVYFRFEQDTNNTVRNWLNKLTAKQVNKNSMNESSMSIKVPHSNVSSGVSAKSRLFQKSHTHCVNKLQVRFLSRNSRDLFLFTLRAFICKQDMRNSVIMQRIQTLQTLKSQQDYNKFLEYISLKSQIIRLSQIAKQLQSDRDSKLNDIANMEESISEMTLTYLKIIEEKSQQQHVDLQQSYSMISMKREEILGRKNLRQLKSQNQKLKNHVRELNQQIQLQKFFKKDDNESMVFNQTTNPFMKKNNISGIIDQNQSGSYYIAGQQLKMSEPSHKNMLQLSKSYLKVLEENKKLKQKSGGKHNNNNESRDIENLLESLHESEEQEKRLSQMQATIQTLRTQVTRLTEMNNLLVRQNTELKANSNLQKLNQSINNTAQKLQYSRYSRSQMNNNSMVSNSYMSVSMNQSMTSQAELGLLEKKLIQLANINAKFETENTRLRKERDYFRSLYQSQKVKLTKMQQNYNNNNNNNIKAQQSRINKLDDSNLMANNNNNDNSMVMRLKQDKQKLQNQKNSLLKKIDSLTRESHSLSNKTDSNLDKKYKQLSRVNQRLQEQIETLKKTMENMRTFHQLEKKELQNYTNQAKPLGQSSLRQISGKQEEIQKLKKINSTLLNEVKQLRMEIQRKNDKELKNSRVVELQNQLDIFKTYAQTSNNKNQAKNQQSSGSQEMVKELTQLRKQNQRLKEEINTLEMKIITQTKTIEKLMTQLDQIHQQQQKNNISQASNSFHLKYLSTPGSPTNTQNGELQRYKKKISDLQAQMQILRRNSEAFNRSRDLSLSMIGYDEERLQIYKKENESLMFEIENLNKMCSKYSRDARQANMELNKLRQKLANINKQKFQLLQK